MPSTSRPTSVSSMLPLKMRSPMLATVAMVVPSLKVLLSTTVLPTFTGTSRISPAMVERMSVELCVALLFDTPLRTTSSASCAATCSSSACRWLCRAFSYSSSEMSCWRCKVSARWKSFSACFTLMPASLSRDSAELSCPMSGITFTLAITSPASTRSPASL